MKNIKLVLVSLNRFIGLVVVGRLQLSRRHLGEVYSIENASDYRVFRETTGNDNTSNKPVILIVGFRLKLLRSNRLLHWLFQRICILTTPFWSGFEGFRIKLWMVNPKTKNYLGIYKWAGDNNAKFYAEALAKVLKPLSVSDSVWYRIYPGYDFDKYLRSRKI